MIITTEVKLVNMIITTGVKPKTQEICNEVGHESINRYKESLILFMLNCQTLINTKSSHLHTGWLTDNHSTGFE